MKALLLLLVAGCYGDLRPGVTAPVGPGEGGAAFDLYVAGGAQYESAHLDLGAGAMTGVHGSDTNGYIPFGLEGRIAVALAPLRPGSARDLLLVAHAGAAGASGLSRYPASKGMAPDGVATTFFVGLGPGVTSPGRDVGHVAFGLSAARFWPEDAAAFWVLGGAVEVSYGFAQN